MNRPYGSACVAVANHHWFAYSLDIWRQGLDPGAKDRPDERGNTPCPWKLAEGEQASGIGLDPRSSMTASLGRPKHAPLLFTSSAASLCASLVATGFIGGSSERRPCRS